MIQLLSTIRAYTPAVHNDAQFQITVYSGANGILWVNVRDFYDALEFRKSDVDGQIQKTIDTLKLEEGRDYITEQGNDPIVDGPKYIWTLEVALEASKRIDSDMAEAAVKFFEGIILAETNVFRHLAYDVLLRQPVFPLAHLAYVLHQNLYNDGWMDEKILIRMLKKDRVLTRALRPVPGYEMMFVKIDNIICVTAVGMIHLSRKYLGITMDEAMSLLLENVQYASRLASASLYEDRRVGINPQFRQETELEPEGGNEDEREDIRVDRGNDGSNH